MCGVCFAGVNEKYSYKDFMHKSFEHLPASEFNNSTIVGSCFYQEGEPDQDIFPDGLVNVIFEKNNLDNVLIKSGMTVDSSNATRKIQVQNDLTDWIVEKDHDVWKPKEPIDRAKFVELEISIDPQDIPLIRKTISIIEEKEIEKRNIIPR